MTQTPAVDAQSAHRYFSASCFNLAWKLIEKANRTPDEDEQMIRAAQASLWHWTQRDDVTPRNLSIGHWQLSRIYAALGQADNARRYGRRCLELSRQLEPFYLGYACEALARAESLAGNRDRMQKYLEEARHFADRVVVEEEKNLLLGDLETIKFKS